MKNGTWMIGVDLTGVAIDSRGFNNSITNTNARRENPPKQCLDFKVSSRSSVPTETLLIVVRLPRQI